MGSRIKRFEYRKFPLSGKWNWTQFSKITTGHGNTIEDLANIMVFLLVRILFLYMSNMVCFCFKRPSQASGTVLPGFDHMLTGLDWDFVTEVHWIKVHYRISGSFQNICITQISRYSFSKNSFSLKMGTVCTVCPISETVILKQNPRFSFMEWASFFLLCVFNLWHLNIALLFFKSVYNTALTSIQ